MPSKLNKEKRLTGRHVLIILLTFFGVMLAVNAYFTFVAVKSFRGEDVKGSYRQGLEYNKTIAQREQQNTLGWTARINTRDVIVDGQELIVVIADADSVPITGLNMTGVLRHPVDLGRDIQLDFTDTGNGRFTAQLGNITGQWRLKAIATKDSKPFKFEQVLWVN